MPIRKITFGQLIAAAVTVFQALLPAYLIDCLSLYVIIARPTFKFKVQFICFLSYQLFK